MADAPASLDALYLIAGILEWQKLEYAFIGGIALNVWGIPRSTFDLDVALSLSPERLPELCTALNEAGVVVDAVFQRGFRDRIAGMEKFHVHLPAGLSLLAVDMFLASTPFLRSCLSRRVKIDLGRGSIWVCSAADLVLFKLVANRRKDKVDLDNILGLQESVWVERVAG